MSKNLETEYKQHIENEIPDLWARIESALPEKNIDSADNVVEFSHKSDIKNIVKKKKSRAKILSIASGIIVAAAAAVIIIPAVLSGNLKNSEETAAVSEKSETKKHKKDKADKSSDDANMFAKSAMGMESEESFATADSDDSGVAMDAEYSMAAAETEESLETADYADDMASKETADNVSATESAEEYDSNNSVKSNATDSTAETGIVFIRQYGKDGELNFDDEGNLLRSLDEIKLEDGICITKEDIVLAEPIMQSDQSGIKQYMVELVFADKDKLYDITNDAANKGESIAICYNGRVLSTPNVEAPIKDGKAVINGIENYTEAKKIANCINK